jgi:hypothetical protein
MTDRVRRFYLLATWMPLILPICCATVFLAMGGGTFEGIGASIGMLLVLSLLSTGVPFTIVALWVTHWLRAPKRTERDVRRLMWGAPFIVGAFAAPFWALTLGIEEGFAPGLLWLIGIYMLYLLVIGYLYVVATAAARWALGRGLWPTEVPAKISA